VAAAYLTRRPPKGTTSGMAHDSGIEIRFDLGEPLATQFEFARGTVGRGAFARELIAQALTGLGEVPSSVVPLHALLAEAAEGVFDSTRYRWEVSDQGLTIRDVQENILAHVAIPREQCERYMAMLHVCGSLR